MKLRNSTRKPSYALKTLNNGEHHAKELYGYGELQLVKVKVSDYLKKYLENLILILPDNSRNFSQTICLLHVRAPYSYGRN